jgi:hypothetical protein
VNTIGKYYYGEYNRHYYMVYNQRGEWQYTAGNCHFDSHVYLAPDEPGAVSLRAMRAMCIRCTREIAEENGAKFLNVFRVDEPEASA